MERKSVVDRSLGAAPVVIPLSFNKRKRKKVLCPRLRSVAAHVPSCAMAHSSPSLATYANLQSILLCYSDFLDLGCSIRFKFSNFRLSQRNPEKLSTWQRLPKADPIDRSERPEVDS